MITMNWKEILKVFWMSLWRLVVLESIIFKDASHFTLVLLLSIGISLGLILGLHKSIRAFPLINLFRKKQVLIDLQGNRPYSRPQTSTPLNFSRSSTLNTPLRPSRFTPQQLKGVPLPFGSNVLGAPGKGLQTGTGLSARNVSLGKKGEENFAKALVKEGLASRFTTAWSLRMPRSSALIPDPSLNTDVDCVLVSGNDLYLIDLKYYKGGDIVYQSSGDQLYSYDRQTGQPIGGSHRMTQNMKIAYERFARLFKGYRVYALVVFVPTERGAAALDNVIWPGNIPAVPLDEMIDFLHTIPGTTASDTQFKKKIYPLTLG